MRKEDGYIGARVVVENVGGKREVSGTIIDDACRMDYDFLVEFDEYVGGHNGFDWGAHTGKHGHCFWVLASECDELGEEVSYSDIEISLSFENLTE